MQNNRTGLDIRKGLPQQMIYWKYCTEYAVQNELTRNYQYGTSCTEHVVLKNAVHQKVDRNMLYRIRCTDNVVLKSVA